MMGIITVLLPACIVIVILLEIQWRAAETEGRLKERKETQDELPL